MSRRATIRKSLAGMLRTIRHFWPYLRKHRRLIVGSITALLGSVALKTLEPWPIKIVIDEVLGVGANSEWASQTNPLVLLGAAGAAVVTILVLSALTTYTYKVGFALIGNRALTEIRGDLYRHIQCLSLSFHTSSRRGDLIVRMTGDIGRLKEVTTTAFMPLVASVLVMVVMAGLMLFVNWSLAIVVLATLPLYTLPTTRLGNKIRKASKDQRKREGAMAATASESIHAIEVVQALSLEGVFTKAFSGQNKKSLKEGVKIRRLAARLQGTVEVMIGISTAIVLFYGGVLALRGTLTPGELLVFLAYLKAMFKPMQNFAKYSSRLAKASAASDRVMELFELTPAVVNSPNAVEAPALEGNIEFRDVSFSYGNDDLHLSNIDLSIKAGQRIAIVGGSGHGKSTLVSLVPRLYDPTEGIILLDGTDVKSYTLESVRRQISIVLQTTTLFAVSVAENISYGAADVTLEDITRAAELANADPFIRQLPRGYDTVLGEGGSTISAGQRQRIALARAAVRKTPIIILDEPTTGLDEGARQKVITALETVCRERTVLLVTHDLDLAANSDRVIFLENGTIVEDGPHSVLLERRGRYERLYTLQRQAFVEESPDDHVNLVQPI